MDKERRLGQRHALPPVKHKVFVATPAYDGKVDTDYAMCLAQSAMHAVHQEIGVASQVMGNGAFIEMARNIFVKNFLSTDCDILFFIDADLKWESRAFVGLIQSGREVCAGAYRKRQEPEEYPLHYIENPDEPGLRTIEGGWIACDRVATGFLCIHRHVLEKMSAAAPTVLVPNEGEIPWVFHTKFQEDEDGNRFMGEDFAWCDDYMDSFDGPIWVWPDFDFSHAGYDCNWHKFMNSQMDIAINEERTVSLLKASPHSATDIKTNMWSATKVKT